MWQTILTFSRIKLLRLALLKLRQDLAIWLKFKILLFNEDNFRLHNLLQFYNLLQFNFNFLLYLTLECWLLLFQCDHAQLQFVLNLAYGRFRWWGYFDWLSWGTFPCLFLLLTWRRMQAAWGYTLDHCLLRKIRIIQDVEQVASWFRVSRKKRFYQVLKLLWHALLHDQLIFLDLPLNLVYCHFTSFFHIW